MTIAIPSHLSDGELTARLSRCARDERHQTALLVAHLAEFDARQLHLAAGYSSLFAYCCEVLGLSEDAACNRIEAARACRLFPVVLERMADGSLSVTTVRLLARRLTPENHVELVTAASRRSRRVVEELIASRFPRPDTPSSVRKVPERLLAVVPFSPSVGPEEAAERPALPIPPQPATAFVPSRSDHRPPVRPLATDRYEFRFTGSAAMRDKLRVAQDLERHAVPTGDVARILERALDALIEKRSQGKLAIVRKPQRQPRPTERNSRHVPSAVRREVWARDGGHCAFVGASGHRCSERAFLEYHHVEPYAAGGEATVGNIQLRCRAHNGYEKDLFFGSGKGGVATVREAPPRFTAC